MRALDRQQVGGLFDHADHLPAAARVGAERARVALGEREADRAQADLVLDREERVGQALRVVAVGAQDVEGEARGGALADPGQARELLDQAGHGRGVRHRTPRLTACPAA